MGNFGYYLREALTGLRRHSVMTLASMGIMAACLLLMGTFSLTGINAAANWAGLEDSNEILAFVDETYPAALEPSLERQLLELPNVATVRLITKEEALAEFQEDHADEDLFQDLDPEIFRDRYAITVEALEGMPETVAEIEAVTGIDSVRVYEEYTAGLLTVRNVAAVVGIALSAVLLLGSLFIISNTTRLAAFDRREEIAIMRIVGATNAFIRWPFVFEGFFMGLAGAVAAFFLQWALYAAVTRGLAGNDALSLIEVIPFGKLWLPVAGGFLAAGVATGVGGSLSAVGKFLRG